MRCNHISRRYLSQLTFKIGLHQIFFFPPPKKIQWLPQLLIETESSSKDQNNPHTQIECSTINFQSCIYQKFPLKPSCTWEIIKMALNFHNIFVKSPANVLKQGEILQTTFNLPISNFPVPSCPLSSYLNQNVCGIFLYIFWVLYMPNGRWVPP